MKKVIVNRTTSYGKNGEPQLVATPNKIYGVTAEIMGSKVRTASGDVWKVRKYDGPDADFIVDEPCGPMKVKEENAA